MRTEGYSLVHVRPTPSMFRASAGISIPTANGVHGRVLVSSGSRIRIYGRAGDKRVQKAVEHARDADGIRRKSVGKTWRHPPVELRATQRVRSAGSVALLCRATGFDAVGVTRGETIPAVPVEASQSFEGRRLLARVAFELLYKTPLVFSP